jgi:hypothetical protein
MDEGFKNGVVHVSRCSAIVLECNQKSYGLMLGLISLKRREISSYDVRKEHL